MTKLLLLRGNPRKDGFTQKMTDLFVSGATENAEVTDIDLTKKKIHSCLGCFNCWTRTPGKCIQKDDMSELIEQFLSTDIVVFSSPLYAFSVSSYLKIFMERLLPLLAPGIIATPGRLERNCLTHPDRMPKIMAGIIVGGLKSEQLAEGVCKSLKTFAEGFGIEYAGTLVRTESYILQFAGTKPLTLSKIEKAFFQAGQELSSRGCFSNKVIEKASLQLSHDLHHFELYSNIYWGYASEVSKRGGNLDEARILTNRDGKLLMHEMVRGVNPVATKGIKAIFQFEFTDTKKVFSVYVNKGTAKLQEVTANTHNLLISCKESTWVSILLKELDPMKALCNGDLVLTGDKSLFRKLHLYFPPPKL